VQGQGGKGPTNLGFEVQQTPYESASQNARVMSEGWMRRWAFCPACGHEEISQFANNRPAADFSCPHCAEQYELKSTKGAFGNKVVDGAYETLCKRLSSDENPNFAFMNYSATARSVENLFVVPKQFVRAEIVERRKPLAPTARRAGWIGCNIRLNQIPLSGKIFVVRDGQPIDKRIVLEKWNRTLFLREEKPAARGWLIDVMGCCDAIGIQEFAVEDIYRFETRLSTLYPNNNNVRAKIRQQLQVLRDGGYLEFLGSGHYRKL
jgi:type II restriction enzyme